MTKNTVRRSQCIVPFGVGSIYEFEREALMPAGLDEWAPQAEQMSDDRLAARLSVDHFRVPPPKPEKGTVLHNMAPMPFVRFPQWHFCPRCRFLKKADLYAQQRPRCDNPETSPRLAKKPPCVSLDQRRRQRMRPTRFVAVCEAGHIEDFPWNAWVHAKPKQGIDRDLGCKPERLYFYPTKIGGLSGLFVSCSACGAKRSLAGSTNRAGLKGFSCRGERPWLGKDASEKCAARPQKGESYQMMALQRGASNLYFPLVASSILIPPFSSKVHRVLSERAVHETLTSSLTDGRINQTVLETVARMRNVDPDQLREAFDTMRGNPEHLGAEAEDETTYRRAEYRALQQERRDHDDLLTCRPIPMENYGSTIQDHLSGVTIVERLAETRALTGFHRVTPGGTPASSLSLGHVNWLPAFRVYGEGIFLNVRKERLAEYHGPETKRLERFLSRAAESARCPLELSPELILLHTLAHLLIKRLSYEAGYGSSSIRERIYSSNNPHERMNGILLYTAAGDADGTLGGLVELARPQMLERALAGALEEARWCAADPICRESSGQGPESLNLAACHACTLLPETSCELQNRFLDRTAVTTFFGY